MFLKTGMMLARKPTRPPPLPSKVHIQVLLAQPGLARTTTARANHVTASVETESTRPRCKETDQERCAAGQTHLCPQTQMHGQPRLQLDRARLTGAVLSPLVLVGKEKPDPPTEPRPVQRNPPIPSSRLTTSPWAAAAAPGALGKKNYYIMRL